MEGQRSPHPFPSSNLRRSMFRLQPCGVKSFVRFDQRIVSNSGSCSYTSRPAPATPAPQSLHQPRPGPPVRRGHLDEIRRRLHHSQFPLADICTGVRLEAGKCKLAKSDCCMSSSRRPRIVTRRAAASSRICAAANRHHAHRERSTSPRDSRPVSPRPTIPTFCSSGRRP